MTVVMVQVQAASARSDRQQVASAGTVAAIWLYTDLTPSGDKMVLELQNLVFSSQ